MNKRVVFFGGTFDPPHREHIAMAKACYDKFRPNAFVVMPTAIPPHKKTFFSASAEDRLRMCGLAFAQIPSVEISDFEIARGGKSYSYVTVGALHEKYPDAEIIFLMGTDMLSTFGEWKNPSEILRFSTPCLVVREGENETREKSVSGFKEKFDREIYTLDYVGKDVSSTDFKIDYMLGLDVSEMVSEEVFGYLRDRGLYRNEYFDFVRQNLKPSRVIHTAGVIKEALRLAKRLGEDPEKTVCAAVLHDCAKYLDYKDYPEFVLGKDVPEPVIHQYLGAYIAEKVLGEKDEEILDAIKYHTSGRPAMTTLGKIIFVADMIEGNRNYPELNELRAAVEKDFDEGFVLCLEKSVEFVLGKKSNIYKLSVDALDYYKQKNNRRKIWKQTKK